MWYTTQHARSYTHCFRLLFIYIENTGINIIINLFGCCIFKSYVISEKRTTPYDIVKLLKYELFILFIYLKATTNLFYHIIQ